MFDLFYIILLIGIAKEIVYCGADVHLSFKNFSRLTKEFIDVETVLLPNSEEIVYLEDVPIDVDFLIVQSHSFLYYTILSSESSLTHDNHVKGTNIGLFYRTNSGSSSLLFLKNPHEFNVSCMLVAVPYTDESPVPGGCNMEASVPIAPYLNLEVSSDMITVEGSPASSSLLTTSCGLNSPLSYIMYYKYLPERDFTKETYFEAIGNMLTYPTIINSSSYVAPEAIEGPILRRIFNKYSGTGTVYTMIVFNKLGNIAVYTPAFTYACENIFDSHPCELMSSPLLKFEFALLMSISAFVCFAGHRYFLGELFFIGTITGGFTSYIVLMVESSFSGDALLISTGIGLLSGIIWVCVWWWVKSPLLSVSLTFIGNSFLMSSLIFYLLFAEYNILQSDTNYWLLFCTMVFMFFLISTTNAVKYNMLACSFIGAYGILFPLDYYIGSNLKYILINVIRRATIEGFNMAIAQPPFQLADAGLFLMWISFLFSGYKTQKKWSENRPPFPPVCLILRQQVPETMPILTNARFPTYT